MAANDLFSDGNQSFVDENYEEAVELYSKAIAASKDFVEAFSNRANAYLKLEQYGNAAEDAVRALEINPNNGKVHLRKGIAFFHQGKFSDAKEAFENGKRNCEDKSFDTWLQKCNDKIPVETSKPTEVPSIPMPSGAKTRFDWYQTDKAVVVTILLKGINKDDVSVAIQAQSMSACVRLGGGSDYTLELDLAHPIIAQRSSWKVLATKIEIKLAKEEGIRWSKLERDPGDDAGDNVKQFMASTVDIPPPKYPSSRPGGADWDAVASQVAKEEKEEKPDGDAALNQLFQQIYRDGNDETRKAMNKSFQESGGTVLSTNWSEICKAKTDVKPPDGMEYKKYQQ